MSKRPLSPQKRAAQTRAVNRAFGALTVSQRAEIDRLIVLGSARDVVARKIRQFGVPEKLGKNRKEKGVVSALYDKIIADSKGRTGGGGGGARPKKNPPGGAPPIKERGTFTEIMEKRHKDKGFSLISLDRGEKQPYWAYFDDIKEYEKHPEIVDFTTGKKYSATDLKRALRKIEKANENGYELGFESFEHFNDKPYAVAADSGERGTITIQITDPQGNPLDLSNYIS